MNNLEEQIKTQFRKAFDDLLEESLKSDKPDWDWLTKLYKELRDRICNLTPHRKDRIAEIYEHMDADLFHQMVSNNAFDAESMIKLVDYVFFRIRELEAPARNPTTDAKLAELKQIFFKEGTTFGSFVPQFLKFAHRRIDEIDDDKQKFLAQFKK